MRWENNRNSALIPTPRVVRHDSIQVSCKNQIMLCKCRTNLVKKLRKKSTCECFKSCIMKGTITIKLTTNKTQFRTCSVELCNYKTKNDIKAAHVLYAGVKFRFFIAPFSNIITQAPRGCQLNEHEDLECLFWTVCQFVYVCIPWQIHTESEYYLS